MIDGKKNNKQTISFGTNYELNKDLVEKYEKELTEEELKEKENKVINFLKETNQGYYTLLCNDRRDFTVFRINHGNKQRALAADVLINECLKNRGLIKGIDLTQTKDAIEIWLSIEGESYCYYFFPYDAAVIEIL